MEYYIEYYKEYIKVKLLAIYSKKLYYIFLFRCNGLKPRLHFERLALDVIVCWPCHYGIHITGITFIFQVCANLVH